METLEERDYTELIPALFDSIDDDIWDSIADLGDLTLDSVLSNKSLPSIPFFKVIVGFGKTVINIRKRNLMIQTASFIQAFRKGKPDEKAISDYRKRMNEEPQFASRELGRVLILIDRNIDTIRSELLGHLYRSLLLNDITWSQFVDLTVVTSKCVLSDLPLLENIRFGEVTESNEENIHQVERLAGLGLVDRAMKTIFSIDQKMTMRYFVYPSSFGALLYDHSLKYVDLSKDLL